MFEQSAFHARRNQYRLLTVSAVIHGTAIAAIAVASLQAVEFPTSSPPLAVTLRVAAPVPVPPPAGSGARTVTPHRGPAAPRPSSAPADATPALIPDAIPDVSPESTGPASDDPSDPGGPGSPDGVKGGLDTGDAPSSIVQAPEKDRIYVVGGDVIAPVVTRRVSPIYPAIAMRAHMNGTVVVSCIIDRHGDVRDVRVVRSTFGAFEQTAIDAVSRWTFTPGTLRGVAVDTQFELTVRFELH